MREKGYAVITGASSGIGMEFARRLSKEGYPLVLVARRKERLLKLSDSLKTECIVITADLRLQSECERLLEELSSVQIEIFINNAGFGRCSETLNIEYLEELDMIDVNVKAVHLLTKRVLAEMVKKDRGYLLNVASSAGLLPAGPYMSTYYATKAYVVSFTRGVAEELRRSHSHVYVGCLCPGPVDTEFNRVANVKFALKGITAYTCANEAVDGMFRKKTEIIPTFQMKALLFFSRWIPAKFSIRIAARQQKKKLWKK